MRIYNTLTRQKEEFQPADPKKVKMFVCGPTVYDYAHIGHARTYVTYDVIAKYLRHRGYDVFYLQNITDIDDKIIERAKQKMINPGDLAQEYKEAYYEYMKKLGVDNDKIKYAPATQYIPEIVSQVQRLIEKEIAYLIDEEGYYFDLTKFPDYGKLSGRTMEAAEDATSRIDESIKKRNKGDFALWKFSKPEEPGYPSDLGYGRPGWHIEDTAITEKYFGQQYDLHGGARDLIFPHHEAEIAQMETISGKKPFVKYWVHSGFLTVNGQKMSKSLGNFVTIRNILEKYPPEALRLMFLMTHYRSPIDYTEENLKQAAEAVTRISDFRTNLLQFHSKKRSDNSFIGRANMTLAEIQQAVDDDFDTPQAFAILFGLIREVGSQIENISSEVADKLEHILNFFHTIFGIIIEKEEKTKKIEFINPDGIPSAFNLHTSSIVGVVIIPEIEKLVTQREKARKNGKWAEADELRNQIKNLGYEVEDTAYGPLIKKL